MTGRGSGRTRRRLRAAGRVALRRARSYLERRVLLLVLLISACGWAFAQLADETREGETVSFDRAVLLALRNPADPTDPLGPGWIEEFGRDVTGLGGVGVLTALTLAVAGFLRLQGRRGSMWLVLAAVAGGQAASTLFKLGFDRPRPDLVPHGTLTYTSSFPSGHAMMAAVTYLTLAALLARVQPRRRLKAYILTLALLVTFAVGVSRVYLGVHWPTDVLAGWTAGAGWALLCLLAARALQRRGTIDPAAPGLDRPSPPARRRGRRNPNPARSSGRASPAVEIPPEDPRVPSETTPRGPAP